MLRRECPSGARRAEGALRRATGRFRLDRRAFCATRSASPEKTAGNLAFAGRRRYHRIGGFSANARVGSANGAGPTMVAADETGVRVILVVDDDEATRSLIERRLQHQGFPTASAATGHEALAKLHEGPKPCLILLDVMMPGETGWDFVERLLRNPSFCDIPTVLMSANPTAMKAYNRVREQGTSLLPKPLDVKRLAAVAAAHCRCRLPDAKRP